MRVIVEGPAALPDGQCLAAFMIMLDEVTGRGTTRSSLPELLDDPNKWQSWVGSAYPHPTAGDPADVIAAIRHLEKKLGGDIGPLRRFAFANPSTEEGWALQNEAWQDPRGVHKACRAIRDAIRDDNELGILDSGEGCYPYLAYSDAHPQAGRPSELDKLMAVAFKATQQIRILLAGPALVLSPA